jgi:hypothetical protein
MPEAGSAADWVARSDVEFSRSVEVAGPLDYTFAGDAMVET